MTGNAGGRQQPFYHVVVDERDRPGTGTNTYVAQDNVGVLEGNHAYETGCRFRGPLKVHADSRAIQMKLHKKAAFLTTSTCLLHIQGATGFLCF